MRVSSVYRSVDIQSTPAVPGTTSQSNGSAVVILPKQMATAAGRIPHRARSRIIIRRSQDEDEDEARVLALTIRRLQPIL